MGSVIPSSIMTTLFISDLHLCPTRPSINRLFFGFLEDTAAQALALYVLGDLFEYWAGDDDLADPFNHEVALAFARLSKSGVALYFMHGNRDFLLGDAFVAACGGQLLPDPTLIHLYGKPTLLMHGDSLCIDDLAYMAFRNSVRDPLWQSNFLAQPLAQRKTQIEALRRDSEREKKHKSDTIMDVNPSAVLDVLHAHQCPRLIHGHTHRPARYLHEVDGKACERWVLTDWYLHGGYLSCDADGCRAFEVHAD